MSDNEEKTIVLDLEKLKRELNIGAGAAKEDASGVIEQSIDFGENAAVDIPEANYDDNTPGIEATEIFSVEDMEIEIAGSSSQENTPSLSEPKEIKEEVKPSKQILLFDFKSNFFKSSVKDLKDHITIVTALTELNALIKDREEKILVFNYLVQPNAVNKLMFQLNKKFPHITSVIVGKKFSPKRVQMHQGSPYGAAIYIDLDSSKDIISDIETSSSQMSMKKSA